MLINRLPVMGVATLVSFTGCLWTSYSDLVDDISDHPLRFDQLYYAPADLTRLDNSDGCRVCNPDRASVGFHQSYSGTEIYEPLPAESVPGNEYSDEYSQDMQLPAPADF